MKDSKEKPIPLNQVEGAMPQEIMGVVNQESRISQSMQHFRELVEGVERAKLIAEEIDNTHKTFQQQLEQMTAERDQLAMRNAELLTESMQLKEENAKAWELAIKKDRELQQYQSNAKYQLIEQENRRLRAVLVTQQRQIENYETTRPFATYA